MESNIQIGHWKKICDLGSGSFGVVSLWENTNISDYVAVKKCKFLSSSALTLKQKERWKKEVDMIKLINHDNIIKFKQIPTEFESGLQQFNPSKLPLLCMEYCHGGNLRHVLQRSKNMSGLEETDVRDVLWDISSALQHLHNLKITHRDLKPENIVLQNSSNRTVYKIIDLGYAKNLNDSTVSFVGTLHYLAPEIFETVKYDSSVDYWSMGIMTFEIICGVLPFLPHLTPVQRFHQIEKKAPNDICIYLSYSGQVTKSSELKKENYVSTCLKSHIEEWLRHVLQFSPTVRAQLFPNGMRVFEYLQDILKKKIVNVFSVYKFEFYSYEIHNSTLVGTLKDWICRDIKSSKNDLIFLFGKNNFFPDNTALLCDVLKNETNVYVMKKDAIVSSPMNYVFPKLVKEFMKSVVKFDFKYLPQLYAQAVFYVASEKAIAKDFKISFHLFLESLTYFIESLKLNIYRTSKSLVKLLTKVECYNSIRNNNTIDIDFKDDRDYKNCLTYNRRLLDSLERSISYFEKLERKYEIVTKRHKILQNSHSELIHLLDGYNLDTQYQQVLNLWQTAEKGKNMERFITGMQQLVSNTIKIKEMTFKNERFKTFTSAMFCLWDSTRKKLFWLEDFEIHIQQLSDSFVRSEVFYRTLLIKSAIKNNNEEISSVRSSLNGELNALPSEYLIRENQDIRARFEEILAESITAHTNYKESIMELFT